MRLGAILVALLLLTAGALAFRLPALGNRPMHGDEAVHAFKFRELWEKGVYRYDPNEFHGPTLYYAALPSVWLNGRRGFADTREADYRLPVAVFGAALVLLLIPLADGLGRGAAVWAGILTAISPAFVFYSRYYIQETLLAFFTLAMLVCGWRYSRSGRPAWLLGAGVCAGLMVATKETSVLAFGAFAVALALTVAWSRWVDGHARNVRRLWNGKMALAALAVSLVTACLLLSGLLSHPAGPLDYLRSYTPWLRRAHGTDLHRHPWYYYLQILIWARQGRGPIWSEGLIVGLAVVGLVAALLPKRRSPLEGSPALARFLAFYTVALTLAYSAIPYKTPWCVLCFLNGMILLAGLGAGTLMRIAPGRLLRTGVAVLLLAGCTQLAVQSYRTSYVSYTDGRNPYVYAQTVPDIEDLQTWVQALARVHPQHEAMVIKVFSVDTYYWPLPWYLRRFPNVGYWTEVPADADAPVVLASPEFDEVLTKKLDATHLMNGYVGLRPAVFLEKWVRLDLWTAYVKTRKAARPAEPGS